METPAGVEVEEVQETDKEEEADIGIVKTEDDDEEEDDEEEDDEDDDDEEDDEKKCRVDIELIRDGLTPGAEGEVPIVPYLSAYIEIYKCIKLMGPLFYFVAYDVKLKINILKKELAGKNRQHYVDVRTMIAYEKKNNLMFRPDCLSGTNALLQLHRLLEFLPDFMKELVKDDEEEPALG
ncbi:Ceramide-1-phosphate transfer protein [Chionoecetes opilio]|uniref:Ceramide-1-phosphate transfer protein n=1 Tax=Chionoecetes opilio TaxID=41210 RepID=A0A8J4Y975_CHIOP|nr:Ceramide-1-phosphate transfer protein [Chionoecetes opilio]